MNVWKGILARTAAPRGAGPVEFILAGLGNPGSKYENTRHNAGFMALDAIAEEAGVSVDRMQFKGLTARAQLGGKSVLLLKPSTFMNLSGESIREAMQFYHLPPEKVIVFFDDISLEPGRLRIRRKGSSGGHNGMKNIIYLTGKDTFPRVKLGVGHKPEQWDLADWVLSRFTKEEGEAMKESAAKAAAAAVLMVDGQIQEAMNRYNS